MMDEIRNQEIETSLLLLGFAYAATIMTLIVWFAGQIGS